MALPRPLSRYKGEGSEVRGEKERVGNKEGRKRSEGEDVKG